MGGQGFREDYCGWQNIFFDILNALQFVVLDLLGATICWMQKLAMSSIYKKSEWVKLQYFVWFSQVVSQNGAVSIKNKISKKHTAHRMKPQARERRLSEAKLPIFFHQIVMMVFLKVERRKWKSRGLVCGLGTRRVFSLSKFLDSLIDFYLFFIIYLFYFYTEILMSENW